MEMPRRFEIEPPRRVLIVGNQGSGGEKLADLIATSFSLPRVDLAEVKGVGGGEKWQEAVSAHAARGDWVTYTRDFSTLDATSRRAEWFVWLDLPVSACVSSVLRRAFSMASAHKTLAGVSHRRRESLWSQIRHVLNYPIDATPKIIAAVERERRNRTIFILRTQRDVRDFVAKLPKISGLDDRLASERGPLQ